MHHLNGFCLLLVLILVFVFSLWKERKRHELGRKKCWKKLKEDGDGKMKKKLFETFFIKYSFPHSQ